MPVRYLRDLSKKTGDAVATDEFVQPIHNYGVLTPTFAQYANVPLYDANRFLKSVTTESTTGTYAPVVTLANPPVRDQGQIGSCTAFCGTEDRHMKYFIIMPTAPFLLFYFPAYPVLYRTGKKYWENGSL